MSFIMPELVIESVIRDGLASLVNRPEQLDSVFASLTANYNSAKYGQREINKIKNLILETQIRVVHNLHDVGAAVPCFSIQLGMDADDKKTSSLEDYSGILVETIDDPDDLAELYRAQALVITSYDSTSGKIIFDVGSDLSSVKKGNLLIDASDQELTINIVINTATEKAVFVPKGSTVDGSDFVSIKSSITNRNYEEKQVVSDEQIIVGVHSKNALTTKYLYVILKYILLSRKSSLIKRCFIVSSFQGSDFSRNMEYQGDHVYNRFYTVTGKIEDSWKAAEGEQIENVEVEVLVPKAEADANALGKIDHSVKPSDSDSFDC